MSKIFKAFPSLMMVALLCSCGGNPATSESTPATSEQPQTSETPTETPEPTTTSEENSYKLEFDEDNIILSFAAVADPHAGYQGKGLPSAAEMFANSLRYLQTKSKRPFDLVTSSGDNTQNGKKEEVEALMEAYRSVYNVTEVPFFFSHGNHDTYWKNCMSYQEFYDTYGPEVYQYDLDQAMSKVGNRHMKYKGFHFLSLEVQIYEPNNNVYSKETENWLLKTLDECNKDTPDKPIFVFTHCPPYNTVYGSLPGQETADWGSSKTLPNLLKDQPNVILVAGHTHVPPNDDRNLWQDDNYTAIQVPSTCDIAVDTFFPNASNPSDARTYSYGYVWEIDKDNNSRVTRYDIKHDCMIKTPWIIPAPKADRSHLIPYSIEYRTQHNEAPYSDGEIIMTQTKDDHIIATFDPFKDDDMIYNYKIRIFPCLPDEITNEEEDYLSDVLMMDKWYEHPNGTTDKISIEVPGKYPRRNDWTIKLYGVDSFGLETGYFPTKVVQE